MKDLAMVASIVGLVVVLYVLWIVGELLDAWFCRYVYEKQREKRRQEREWEWAERDRHEQQERDRQTYKRTI